MGYGTLITLVMVLAGKKLSPAVLLSKIALTAVRLYAYFIFNQI